MRDRFAIALKLLLAGGLLSLNLIVFAADPADCKICGPCPSPNGTTGCCSNLPQIPGITGNEGCLPDLPLTEGCGLTADSKKCPRDPELIEQFFHF
jgi:hypothetical protein